MRVRCIHPHLRSQPKGVGSDDKYKVRACAVALAVAAYPSGLCGLPTQRRSAGRSRDRGEVATVGAVPGAPVSVLGPLLKHFVATDIRLRRGIQH
jgi:hypothetical protein